jgi:hypothetical protein
VYKSPTPSFQTRLQTCEAARLLEMIGKKKLVARVSGYSLIGTSDEETGRRKVALLGVLHARGIIG